MRVYGIKSCDTVRKAMKELVAAGREPILVDMRETPLEPAVLERFYSRFGEAMVNKRSTTWRGLDDLERAEDPLRLLSAYPTLIKRPVIEDGDVCTLGWDASARETWL